MFSLCQLLDPDLPLLGRMRQLAFTRQGTKCGFVNLLHRKTSYGVNSPVSRRKLLSCQATTGAAYSSIDRNEFTARQQKAFESLEVAERLQQNADDPEVIERLKKIASAAPQLGAKSRVIDVGTGTGVLIPYLQAFKVQDILAVDLSETMLEQVRTKFGSGTTLGNTLGVNTWHGDVLDLPPYMGDADAIYMNSVFGNFFAPRDVLLHCTRLLRPGGHLVISHPLGRNFQTWLHKQQPDLIPYTLPREHQVEKMIADLPLRLMSFEDSHDLYLAVLQVPPHYEISSGAHRIQLESKVVRGQGRGSTKMGTPTANLDPEPLKSSIEHLPLGVYFGWAQLRPCSAGTSARPDKDYGIYKTVVNIGRRPTVADQDADITIECHVMHEYSILFYDCDMKVELVGYLRPELRFKSLDDLVGQINTDKALARNQLDAAIHAHHRLDSFFEQPGTPKPKL